MNKIDKIRDIVLAVVLISVLFLGYELFSVSKRLDNVENSISQVVQFINNAVAQAQQANKK